MGIDDMPGQPTTKELPAVPQWAADLIISVKGGFASVNERLDGLEGTDKTLANEVARVVIAVEDLRAADRRHEDDIRRLSERTKDTSRTASSSSLEQHAKLAEEIVKNQERDQKRNDTHALAVATAENVDKLSTAFEESKQDLQLAVLKRIDRFFDFVDKVRTHRLTKLVVGIVTLLLASYAAKRGLLP